MSWPTSKRADFVVQFMVQLARAVYWIKPLMWVASKQIALESEGACDDLVLAGRTRASDYAEHLLAIAAGLKEGFFLKTASRGQWRGRPGLRPGCRHSRLASESDETGHSLAPQFSLLLLAIIVPVAALRAANEAEEPVPTEGSPSTKPTESPGQQHPRQALLNGHHRAERQSRD